MKTEKEYRKIMNKINDIIHDEGLNSLEAIGILDAIKMGIAIVSFESIKEKT